MASSRRMFARISNNAFRILGLPATATLAEVYRRQRTLELALEMDEPVEPMIADLGKQELNREEILAAVHRVEDHSSRIWEEAYWLLSPGAGPTSTSRLLPALQIEASKSDDKGALAKHDLAVLSLMLATEHAMEPNPWVRCKHLEQSLDIWKSLSRDESFWLAWERHRPADEIASGDIQGVRRELPKQLTALITDIVSGYSVQGEAELTKQYCTLLKNSSAWAPSAIEDMERLGKDILARAKSDLDGCLSDLVDDSPPEVLKRLKARLPAIHTKVQMHLDSVYASSNIRMDWDDTLANGYRSLAVAYFNTQDDNTTALELTNLALGVARSESVVAQLKRDQNWLFFQIPYQRAGELIEKGLYQAALPCLQRALQFAPDEEKRAQILNAIQNCKGRPNAASPKVATAASVPGHRTSAQEELDTTKRSPALYTINGIGLTFYGRRDFDQTTSTYVTTHWFTFFFIPLMAVGAYRVRDSGSNSYLIFGKTRLGQAPKVYNACVAIAILVWIVAAGGSESRPYKATNTYSPTYQAPSRPKAPATNAEDELGFLPDSNQRKDTPQSPLGFLPRDDESSAIELERARLNIERTALDNELTRVRGSSLNLDLAKDRLEQYRILYPSGVPEELWSKYESERNDYNAEVSRHNALVEALRARAAVFSRDVAAFNQRVNEYNKRR